MSDETAVQQLNLNDFKTGFFDKYGKYILGGLAAYAAYYYFTNQSSSTNDDGSLISKVKGFFTGLFEGGGTSKSVDNIDIDRDPQQQQPYSLGNMAYMQPY